MDLTHGRIWPFMTPGLLPPTFGLDNKSPYCLSYFEERFLFLTAEHTGVFTGKNSSHWTSHFFKD